MSKPNCVKIGRLRASLSAPSPDEVSESLCHLVQQFRLSGLQGVLGEYEKAGEYRPFEGKEIVPRQYCPERLSILGSGKIESYQGSPLQLPGIRAQTPQG